MEITRYSWATVFIESSRSSVLIDPLGDEIPNQEKLLAARLELL
ncbi:hypothetical protein [Bacillus sp. FJAT-29790]|nr:hypothetical protein [Bacillus sp. FJAT-29790]